jgi:hypothetical protein
MKTKLYLMAAASVLALSLAAPAHADVFIVVHVTKNKDVFVFENIQKYKFVNILVDTPLFELDSAAEAQAIVNARNSDGEVNGFTNTDPAFLPVDVTAPNNPLRDYEIFLRALIDNSINSNTGIVGVNQDVGNMANQGNVLSLSVTGRPFDAGANPAEAFGDTSNPAITHSQAEVDQRNERNKVYNSEFLSVPGDPAASVPNIVATISNSVNGNAGIVGVNQNAGNFANQHTVVAIAIGFEGVVALTEAALGQVNTNHNVIEIETIKYGTIVSSGNSTTGIVGINQIAGNYTNQAHVVSFSALASTAVIGVPGG